MTFFETLRENFPSFKLLEQEPLANHTSFRTGGPAMMAFPTDPEALTALYRFCLQKNVMPMILGAGTNVLAPDAGLERLVICTREMSALWDSGNDTVTAQCGVSMTKLANFARDRSLTGLEFAHGIPGSVGGGVYMNAGAYGGEICQAAVKTTALLPDGSLWIAEGEQHGFSYRHSAFQKRGAVILETVFRLRPGDREAISARMQELAAKRKASQPLEYPSAGSTFKRPVGGYAAALIDQAGLKGKGVGKAAVSEKHAGFVINLGGATTEDVLDTMAMVQKEVYDHSGIRLEPEVRIW